MLGLPWIITIGPLGQDEDWEPIVCGPYERSHALGLAEAVVADEDLLAVVEPLLSLVTVEEIRDEIAAARSAADDEARPPEVAGADGEDVGGYQENGDKKQVEAGRPPSPDEIRAGIRRIAASLASAG